MPQHLFGTVYARDFKSLLSQPGHVMAGSASYVEKAQAVASLRQIVIKSHIEPSPAVSKAGLVSVNVQIAIATGKFVRLQGVLAYCKLFLGFSRAHII
jgi:hypothetical protein